MKEVVINNINDFVNEIIKIDSKELRKENKKRLKAVEHDYMAYLAEQERQLQEEFILNGCPKNSSYIRADGTNMLKSILNLER